MNSPRALLGRVRVVLCQAIGLYDGPTGLLLRKQLDRLDGPLRVAVAGQLKAGKSTLLNALVGEQIAPTDAGECTKVVTWYRYGHQPRITLYPNESAPIGLPVRKVDGALRLDLRGLAPDAVDRLLVDWPSANLRETVLIDTPGLGSASAEVSGNAVRFFSPEAGPADADAVVYLMRHLHRTDIRLLESFHTNGIGQPGPQGNPLATVAVLSRADEIGVGRLDALQSARRVAERYRADDRLRVLCGTVVPVAGLLAQTARTLRQEEFSALAALSTAPRAELDAALLSVDRFTGASPELAATLGVSAAARAALLERFGLFGVRLGSVLVRQGFGEPPALAAELVRRSGIDLLRGVLATRFAERRDLLKARSALQALDTVLRNSPRPDTEGVRRMVEHIIADAHEFTELRVLSMLRAGRASLPGPTGAEAERLLGGSGGQIAARLGLPRDAPRAEQRAVVLAALQRWQALAEHPLSGRAFVDVARVVIRTCEGIVAEVS
ncbi:MAG TPA: dynamin family protein [Pseudonocardiaceae bacterium]|jgi:hypothetical protein|nr:dynamin family protein [Pseudonocardiaceae bacterium]